MRRLVSALPFIVVALFLAAPHVRAQRQMEALGRGLIAVRATSTQAYVGWRLLGDEPTDTGFHVYRSLAGATPVRITTTPITNSTNYLDTPGSTALAGAIAYSIAPVLNGIEQARSPSYILAANSVSPASNTLTLPSITLPLATPYPNPATPTTPYDVKFCWVGDFDGDGEYDFLVDRVGTAADLRQYLEAYKRDGTFLWRMDMGPNSVNQYAYEPGSSAISVGDTDNVTVYDLDGDGLAEVAVRTANGVTVTNAAGQVMASISAASDTSQFVSIINGLTGAELARTALPNPWAQYGTLTSKCAVAYLDGKRPSVLFYGYNRDGSGPFYRVFSTFDYRNGQLSLRWSTPQTFAGAEGHQIRVADVDNDGKDEICDIGHVIDDNGTQLFAVNEMTHGDRFHIADINPDRPGLENYIIQQNNPTFLATAFYDAGTGQMLKKWYATDVVDVGRGISLDLNSTHKGYEMYSTQGGIFNAKGQQIYANNVWAPEGLWWDADLLREFIDGPNNGATSPVINKFNQAVGTTGRLWNLYNSSVHQAYGGRPAFWGDILGDWREEVVVVANDYASLRIFTTHQVATDRFYTLMHNPAYRMQATTKGYVQGSNVDYYLGADMTVPPPPPMVRSRLVWAGGSSGSAWAATSAWRDSATASPATYTAGDSVLFDLSGGNSAPVSLAGEVRPGDVTVYSPIDYTVDGSAGSLAGAMRLVKAGRGALRITGSHPYSGATTVWDGALRVDGALSGSTVTVWGGTWGGALARGQSGGRLAGSGSVAQPVSLQYRGALTPGAGMNAVGTLSLGAGLAAADGSVLAFDLATTPAASDRVTISGNLALSGTVALIINPLAGTLAPGAYTLLTYTGSLSGSASNLSVIAPDGTPYTLSLGSGALVLNVPVTRAPGSVTWTGSVSGTWDVASTQNWLLSGSAAPFVAGDSVAFDATGSARPSLSLNVAVPVSGLTLSGSANYTIAGSGAIAGSGGLTKSGSGVVTLSTTNTFTGPVSITGGVLAVDNLADGGEPSSIGAAPAAASNFVINGGTLRLAGAQTNTNRALTLGAAGAVIDTPVTFQISGGITGSGSLTKTGAGAFILANANTYSGGTVLQSGTLVLASDTANTSGLGSGGVTLQGGTLRMYDNTGSYNTSSWAITVPSGASARFEADGRSTLAGTLSGNGTLEFYTSFIRTDVTGNWSSFNGTLNVTTDSDGGDFRISNTSGMAGAAINLASTASAYSVLTSSHNFAIGALSGSGSLSGIGAAARTVTWQIGAKNTNTTYSGVISNGAGSSALTKVGSGTLTLSGVNTYTGNTTISAGHLVLAGGALSGNGTIGTNVTVSSGAGFGGTGTLTGNITLANGSTLLSNPAGPLAITGNLAFSGNVTVAPVAGATLTPGNYTLYTFTGTRTGSPTYAWNGPGYNAVFDSSVSGQVTYTLAPSVLPPTNLQITAGDAQASLFWTASASATGYAVKRAAVSGGPYTTLVTGLAGTTYVDTSPSNGLTYYYIVTALGSGGATADSTEASVSVGFSIPRMHLRFDEGSGALAGDSSGGGRNATLVNSPSWIAGRINKALSLASASTQHATLPSGLVSTLADFTISTWVNLTTQATWTRVFDFGTGTTNYMFLATRSSASNFPRFAIRTSTVAEQSVNSTVALTTGSWNHLAVTLSGATATLYLNGVAVGSNSAVTLTPASLGITGANYLGRSQFSPDPYLNGSLDEFQIYARALTAVEVASLASPPAAPAGLSATASAGQAALTWNVVSGANGYAVKRAATAAGPFSTLVTGLATTAYVDTGLSNGATCHYVVTALRSPAESANSAVASVTLPSAPSAPTGLSATAGDSGVSLAWSAVPNATSYSVLRSTTSGSGHIVISNVLAGTSYIDTGLSNGTTYHYVVTASNAAGTGPASAQISATPVAPLSPIQSWRVTHFGTPSATGDAADLADPDNDGAPNLLEYALAGDPLSTASAPSPAVSVAGSPSMLRLAFTRVADPALTYTLQGSTDLASWADLWSSAGSSNVAGPVTVADTAPLSSFARRFLRLRVTLATP